MSVVDNLARKNAETAVMDGLKQMATMFSAPENWMNEATRYFMGALVGRAEKPEFTADQIAKAFEAVIQGHKYNTMPKPADVAAKAREFRPLVPMQKQHTDPTPQRRWTPEERAANIARVEAIQAFLDSQEPEFRACLNAHGYGSPELQDLQARHKAALKAEVDRLAKVF